MERRILAMKNVGKSIGKAALYFLVYFGMQVVVSGVFSFVITTKMTMGMMAGNEEVDVAAMTEKVMDVVMSQAMTMTLIAGILALLIYAIVFLIRKKNFFTETSIGPMPVNGILPVALVAVGFNVMVSMLLPLLPFPESWIASYQQNSSVIGDGNVVIAWICTILLAPVLEEIVFRGLVYTRLKQGMPKIVAAVITSLLFALVHGTIIWGIYTFLLSMILIWTFETYQSLTANILLHLFFNLTGMVLSGFGDISGAAGILMILVAAAMFAAGMFLLARTRKETVAY